MGRGSRNTDAQGLSTYVAIETFTQSVRIYMRRLLEIIISSQSPGESPWAEVCRNTDAHERLLYVNSISGRLVNTSEAHRTNFKFGKEIGIQ